MHIFDIQLYGKKYINRLKHHNIIDYVIKEPIIISSINTPKSHNIFTMCLKHSRLKVIGILVSGLKKAYKFNPLLEISSIIEDTYLILKFHTFFFNFLHFNDNKID